MPDGEGSTFGFFSLVGVKKSSEHLTVSSEMSVLFHNKIIKRLLAIALLSYYRLIRAR